MGTSSPICDLVFTLIVEINENSKMNHQEKQQRLANIKHLGSLHYNEAVSLSLRYHRSSRLTYLTITPLLCFQNMYHAHNDDSLITLKINTIINCFIESQIPPTLQIDVPQEVADKILDHKYEKSPYLFREAQVGYCKNLKNWGTLF